MKSRASRILFVAFQALWLNVIVPGHTRGAVTLGGGADAACGAQAGAHHCCAPAAGKGKQSPAAPTPAQQARCAVCAFAARVTPPPTIDLRPPALELLCVRPVTVGECAVPAAPALTYRGRAPPAAA